jgi:hypothetical protein
MPTDYHGALTGRYYAAKAARTHEAQLANELLREHGRIHDGWAAAGQAFIGGRGPGFSSFGLLVRTGPGRFDIVGTAVAGLAADFAGELMPIGPRRPDTFYREGGQATTRGEPTRFSVTGDYLTRRLRAAELGREL